MFLAVGGKRNSCVHVFISWSFSSNFHFGSADYQNEKIDRLALKADSEITAVDQEEGLG